MIAACTSPSLSIAIVGRSILIFFVMEMSQNDECDKEFGELYLKGYLSEDQYRTLKIGYRLRQLRGAETPHYHKPQKEVGDASRFSGRIANAFRALANLFHVKR